jgi:D-galactarolactone cycloisomerase
MAAMVPNPVRVNPVEPILEFDRTENPFRQAVLTAALDHVDGVVTIPDGPGLGVEINRQALKAFAPKEA